MLPCFHHVTLACRDAANAATIGCFGTVRDFEVVVPLLSEPELVQFAASPRSTIAGLP